MPGVEADADEKEHHNRFEEDTDEVPHWKPYDMAGRCRRKSSVAPSWIPISDWSARGPGAEGRLDFVKEFSELPAVVIVDEVDPIGPPRQTPVREQTRC